MTGIIRAVMWQVNVSDCVVIRVVMWHVNVSLFVVCC
jgi:hypothetical protein